MASAISGVRTALSLSPCVDEADRALAHTGIFDDLAYFEHLFRNLKISYQEEETRERYLKELYSLAIDSDHDAISQQGKI
ncbi:hypothetical protein PYCC9005_005698 [Savitreella phatthalungensis]